MLRLHVITQHPRKELKAGVVEPYLIVDLRGSSFDVSIMKGFRLLFINQRVFVRVVL